MTEDRPLTSNDEMLINKTLIEFLNVYLAFLIIRSHTKNSIGIETASLGDSVALVMERNEAIVANLHRIFDMKCTVCYKD